MERTIPLTIPKPLAEMTPDEFLEWLSVRVDDIIEYNKKELIVNGRDDKIIEYETDYQKILVEYERLKYRRRLFRHDDPLAGLSNSANPADPVEDDEDVRACRNRLLEVAPVLSLDYLVSLFSRIYGADQYLPRQIPDHVDYVRGVPRVYLKLEKYLQERAQRQEQGKNELPWFKLTDFYLQPPADPSLNSRVYQVSCLEVRKCPLGLYHLIQQVVPTDIFMHKTSYEDWFVRRFNMVLGFQYMLKYLDNFSGISRTPQFLRVAYKMGMIDLDKWRELTAREERCRCFAMEAVPELHCFLEDYTDFLRLALECKTSKDLSDLISFMDSKYLEHKSVMDRFVAKYNSDHAAYQTYKEFFLEYDSFHAESHDLLERPPLVFRALKCLKKEDWCAGVEQTN